MELEVEPEKFESNAYSQTPNLFFSIIKLLNGPVWHLDAKFVLRWPFSYFDYIFVIAT